MKSRFSENKSLIFMIEPAMPSKTLSRVGFIRTIWTFIFPFNFLVVNFKMFIKIHFSKEFFLTDLTLKIWVIKMLSNMNGHITSFSKRSRIRAEITFFQKIIVQIFMNCQLSIGAEGFPAIAAITHKVNRAANTFTTVRLKMRLSS